MRKNSKRVALMLSMAMALGTVSASYAKEVSDKIDFLQNNSYVEGYEDGQLKLDNYISRAEMAKLLVMANGGENAAKELQREKGIFSDIGLDHWANGYINVATKISFNSNGLKMINGYPDGTFKPSNNINPGELAKMLLVVSDKNLTEADIKKANENWPGGWIDKAKEEGIFDKDANLDGNVEVKREMAFDAFYNALEKSGKVEKTDSNEKKEEISDSKEETKAKSSRKKHSSSKVVEDRDKEKEDINKEDKEKEDTNKEDKEKVLNDLRKKLNQYREKAEKLDIEVSTKPTEKMSKAEVEKEISDLDEKISEAEKTKEQIELVDSTKEEVIEEKLGSLEGKDVKTQEAIIDEIDKIVSNMSRPLNKELIERVKTAKEEN